MAPEHFFIMSLPRSRTGWLTALFNTGDVACLHDPSRSMLTPEDAQDGLPLGYGYSGSADNGLPWTWRAWQRAYPRARWAVVWRDPAEVLESVARVFPEIPYAYHRQLMADGASRLAEASDALEGDVYELDFSDLEDAEALRGLWEHLIPGEAFDPERAERLQHLRVDMHMAKYQQGVPQGAMAFAMGGV